MRVLYIENYLKIFYLKFYCFLIFFNFFYLYPSEENEKLIKPKIKIAICYWGLTRSSKIVYPSHDKYLFNILNDNDINYEIFMHTWFIGNEKQNVQGAVLEIPPDYEEYKFLNPAYYEIDDQEEFKENSEIIQNFARMNQVTVNYICALESQKRVTDMVIQSKNYYDLIMYIRPDVLLKNFFPVELLYGLKEKSILIPDFHHWGGYNDRFAVLDYETAPIYGKRIQSALDYIKKNKKMHAETYLKYICTQNDLEVLLINFKFDRVRPDGKVR